MGAYLGELRHGVTRDLAEALDWTLTRLERSLSTLDQALRPCGLRLALHGGRITIVGHLDRTHPTTILDLARLDTAPEIDPDVARIIWQALNGLRSTDLETWHDIDLQARNTAECLRLVGRHHGRIRVTPTVGYSLHRRLWLTDSVSFVAI